MVVARRMCWKLWINSLHWPQKYVLVIVLLVDPAFQTLSLFMASSFEALTESANN